MRKIVARRLCSCVQVRRGMIATAHQNNAQVVTRCKRVHASFVCAYLPDAFNGLAVQPVFQHDFFLLHPFVHGAVHHEISARHENRTQVVLFEISVIHERLYSSFKSFKIIVSRFLRPIQRLANLFLVDVFVAELRGYQASIGPPDSKFRLWRRQF